MLPTEINLIIIDKLINIDQQNLRKVNRYFSEIIPFENIDILQDIKYFSEPHIYKYFSKNVFDYPIISIGNSEKLIEWVLSKDYSYENVYNSILLAGNDKLVKIYPYSLFSEFSLHCAYQGNSRTCINAVYNIMKQKDKIYYAVKYDDLENIKKCLVLLNDPIIKNDILYEISIRSVRMFKKFKNYLSELDIYIILISANVYNKCLAKFIRRQMVLDSA